MNAAINMRTLLVEAQKRSGKRVTAFKRAPKIVTVETEEARGPVLPTGKKRQRSKAVAGNDITTNEPKRRLRRKIRAKS